MQRAGLVFANQQIELGARVFKLQLLQGIDGVARARAPGFTGIDLHTGHFSKRQFRHGHAVGCWRQITGFVPRVAGRNHHQAIQAELGHRCACQHHMAVVRRIKRSAEHADALRWQCLYRQTQSRAVKKCVVSASSGEPLAGTCW